MIEDTQTSNYNEDFEAGRKYEEYRSSISSLSHELLMRERDKPFAPDQLRTKYALAAVVTHKLEALGQKYNPWPFGITEASVHTGRAVMRELEGMMDPTLLATSKAYAEAAIRGEPMPPKLTY